MKNMLRPLTVSPFQTQLAHVMQAEYQFTRIIPKILRSVWSSELSRALKRAVAMSESHQESLKKHYYDKTGDSQAAVLDDVESRIMNAIRNSPKGSITDLTLTLLTAKMIQYKIDCYQSLSSLPVLGSLPGHCRVFGAALSDEAATELFLQELAERFLTREFSEGYKSPITPN
nr:DUF892 family protein [uncultured Dyadobacter sp.]